MSPELTRTTEGDEVVDPEADKAELVSDIRKDDKYFYFQILLNWLANEFQILNVVDSMYIFSKQDRRRAKVLDEQHRRLQEAAAGTNAADDDNTELTVHERELVMKSMGTMDEGDAIMGSGAEVNLESQVSTE